MKSRSSWETKNQEEASSDLDDFAGTTLDPWGTVVAPGYIVGGTRHYGGAVSDLFGLKE